MIDGAETGGAEAGGADPLLGNDPAATDRKPRAGEQATGRLCARIGCASAATHTLTADYKDRVMAVGPLGLERTPPALDLCAKHSDLLAPPSGWELLRYNPDRE